MTRLAGKRVLVVGAGAVGEGWGNGKAAAVLMAREGAKVLCLDRNADAAAQTVALITDEGGIAAPFCGDMTAQGMAEAAVAHVVDLWGGLDVLHFNIGISMQASVLDTTAQDWARVFDVNLNAAFAVTKAVLPVMCAQGRGALVYVSSIAAIRGGPFAYPSYEASKAALNRFATSVALEYASKGIRANVIMPGLIDTPHVAAHLGDAKGSVAQTRAALPPMQRQGTAWDVAEAAVFLASDAAGYITGQSLAVDGGLSCIYAR